jgi:uncharacterized membrane protein YfcA
VIDWSDPVFWLLAAVGVIFTGISKSGFAGGVGVVAVPLLALILPTPVAVTLMLPILLLMDALTVSNYHRSVRWDELAHLIPAAVVGIVAGSLMLGMFSDQALQRVLGILCLLFAAWQPLAARLSRAPGIGLFWGVVSGATSTLIHAGGQPLNIYLVSRALPKLNWIATAAVFFAAVNLVKLIPYTLLGQWNSHLLLTALILAPLAIMGVRFGVLIQAHISQRGFLRFCRCLLLLSGSGLIVKGMF